MVVESFNPGDPKYLSCCGCHVTTLTKIICYISFFLCLLYGVFAGLFIPHLVIASLIVLGISAFIFLTPIYGIHTHEPGWLIPYLVLSVIGIGSILLTIILLFVTLIQVAVHGERLRDNARESMLEQMSYDSNFSDADISKLSVSTLLFLLFENFITLGLEIWFTMIVYRCYQYLIERKNAHYAQVTPISVIVHT